MDAEWLGLREQTILLNLMPKTKSSYEVTSGVPSKWDE